MRSSLSPMIATFLTNSALAVCNIIWNSPTFESQLGPFTVHSQSTVSLKDWSYSHTSTCDNGETLGLQIDYTATAIASMAAGALEIKTNDFPITANRDMNLFPKGYWSTPNSYVPFVISIVDNTGHVYRSSQVLLDGGGTVPFSDFADEFALLCPSTLDAAVPNGFEYLDYPDAQEFQLYQMSPTPPAACSSPLKIQNPNDPNDWPDYTTDSALSVDFSTGILTVHVTDPTQVGFTSKMRLGNTYFDLHRCKYSYIEDVANGVPTFPKWISSSVVSNLFVIPEVTNLPAVCPGASKPSIVDMIEGVEYTTGTSVAGTKFEIFVDGTQFTPPPNQIITLSATVPDKASPVTNLFSFTVSAVNPFCTDIYLPGQKNQISVDNPETVFVIDSSFSKDFFFPATLSSDFLTCDYSVTFKGQPITTNYLAFTVIKRASDFVVRLKLNGHDPSLYEGAGELVLSHGSDSIALPLVLCIVETPTITQSPYMTVVKSTTLAPQNLPEFTSSDSQCNDILTYDLTLQTDGGIKSSTVSYDPVTARHQAQIDPIQLSMTVKQTYQATYKVSTASAQVGNDVTFDIFVVDDCMTEDALVSSPISKNVFIDGAQPDIETSYGTWTYTQCAQIIDSFSATCLATALDGQTCSDSNDPSCGCNFFVKDHASQKVSINNVSQLPSSLSKVEISIKGWNPTFGQKPASAQLMISYDLKRCSDQQFEWQAPLLSSTWLYTFKSGLKSLSFGWPTLDSDIISQCQPSQEINLFFGQTPRTILTTSVVDFKEVFTLDQTDLSSLAFNIDTSLNKQTLLSYNQNPYSPSWPLVLSFYVKVRDKNGRIQQNEQTVSAEIYADCKPEVTPLEETVQLPDLTINVAGSKNCTGSLEYEKFFNQTSDRQICSVDIFEDLSLSTNFGFTSKLNAFGPTQSLAESTIEIFRTDIASFEVCFQALENSQIQGHMLDDPKAIDCSLLTSETCVLPYQIEMSSLDGTLGTIYTGNAIWNRFDDPNAPKISILDQGNRAPYIEDFETESSFFEIASNETSVIEIGPIIDTEREVIYVEQFSVVNNYFRPWVKNKGLVLNNDYAMLVLEVSPPQSLEGKSTYISLDLSDRTGTDPKVRQYKIMISVLQGDKDEKDDQKDENSDSSETDVLPSIDTNDTNNATSAQGSPNTTSNERENSVSIFVDQPSVLGILKLSFSRSLLLPSNYTSWTSQNEGAKMFSIAFLASSETIEQIDDDVKLKNFMSWSVRDPSITQNSNEQTQARRNLGAEIQKVNELEIELKFSQPLVVSSGLEQLDMLDFKVNEKLFQLDGAKNFTIWYDQEEQDEQDAIKVKLSRQLKDPAMIDALQTAVEAAETAIVVLMTTNLFSSVFITGLLQYLWALINALQMITHAALFSCVLPINTQILMFSLLRMGNLDIYNTADAYQAIFNFQNMEPFNALFELAGYDTTNFIIESGMLLFGIIGFALYQSLRLLLIFILKRKCNEKDNCLTRRIKKDQDLRSQIQRFFLEGCFGLGLAVAIQLSDEKQRELEHGVDTFSFILACIQIAIYVALVAFIIFAAHKVYYKQAPNHTDYKTLFTSLRIDKKSALAFDIMFLMRRFLVICLITLLIEQSLAQIYLYLAASLVSLLYLILAMPFESRILGYSEIANEIGITLTSYTLFWFTDYVTDPEQEFNHGWSVVLVILLVVLWNVGVFFLALFFKIKLQIKRWYKKREHREEMVKKRQQRNVAELCGQEIKKEGGQLIVEVKVKNLLGQHNTAQISDDQQNAGNIVLDKAESRESSVQSSSSSLDDSVALAIALDKSRKDQAQNQPVNDTILVSKQESMELAAIPEKSGSLIPDKDLYRDINALYDVSEIISSESQPSDLSQTNFLPAQQFQPALLNKENRLDLKRDKSVLQVKQLEFTIKPIDIQEIQSQIIPKSLPVLLGGGGKNNNMHTITPMQVPNFLQKANIESTANVSSIKNINFTDQFMIGKSTSSQPHRLLTKKPIIFKNSDFGLKFGQ